MRLSRTESSYCAAVFLHLTVVGRCRNPYNVLVAHTGSGHYELLPQKSHRPILLHNMVASIIAFGDKFAHIAAENGYLASVACLHL